MTYTCFFWLCIFGNFPRLNAAPIHQNKGKGCFGRKSAEDKEKYTRDLMNTDPSAFTIKKELYEIIKEAMENFMEDVEKKLQKQCQVEIDQKMKNYIFQDVAGKIYKNSYPKYRNSKRHKNVGIKKYKEIFFNKDNLSEYINLCSLAQRIKDSEPTQVRSVEDTFETSVTRSKKFGKTTRPTFDMNNSDKIGYYIMNSTEYADSSTDVTTPITEDFSKIIFGKNPLSQTLEINYVSMTEEQNEVHSTTLTLFPNIEQSTESIIQYEIETERESLEKKATENFELHNIKSTTEKVSEVPSKNVSQNIFKEGNNASFSLLDTSVSEIHEAKEEMTSAMPITHSEYSKNSEKLGTVDNFVKENSPEETNESNSSFTSTFRPSYSTNVQGDRNQTNSGSTLSENSKDVSRKMESTEKVQATQNSGLVLPSENFMAQDTNIVSSHDYNSSRMTSDLASSTVGPIDRRTEPYFTESYSNYDRIYANNAVPFGSTVKNEVVENIESTVTENDVIITDSSETFSFEQFDKTNSSVTSTLMADENVNPKTHNFQENSISTVNILPQNLVSGKTSSESSTTVENIYSNLKTRATSVPFNSYGNFEVTTISSAMNLTQSEVPNSKNYSISPKVLNFSHDSVSEIYHSSTPIQSDLAKYTSDSGASENERKTIFPTEVTSYGYFIDTSNTFITTPRQSKDDTTQKIDSNDSSVTEKMLPKMSSPTPYTHIDDVNYSKNKEFLSSKSSMPDIVFEDGVMKRSETIAAGSTFPGQNSEEMASKSTPLPSITAETAFSGQNAEEMTSKSTPIPSTTAEIIFPGQNDGGIILESTPLPSIAAETTSPGQNAEEMTSKSSPLPSIAAETTSPGQNAEEITSKSFSMPSIAVETAYPGQNTEELTSKTTSLPTLRYTKIEDMSYTKNKHSLSSKSYVSETVFEDSVTKISEAFGSESTVLDQNTEEISPKTMPSVAHHYTNTEDVKNTSQELPRRNPSTSEIISESKVTDNSEVITAESISLDLKTDKNVPISTIYKNPLSTTFSPPLITEAADKMYVTKEKYEDKTIISDEISTLPNNIHLNTDEKGFYTSDSQTTSAYSFGEHRFEISNVDVLSTSTANSNFDHSYPTTVDSKTKFTMETEQVEENDLTTSTAQNHITFGKTIESSEKSTNDFSVTTKGITTIRQMSYVYDTGDFLPNNRNMSTTAVLSDEDNITNEFSTVETSTSHFWPVPPRGSSDFINSTVIYEAADKIYQSMSLANLSLVENTTPSLVSRKPKIYDLYNNDTISSSDGPTTRIPSKNSQSSQVSSESHLHGTGSTSVPWNLVRTSIVTESKPIITTTKLLTDNVTSSPYEAHKTTKMESQNISYAESPFFNNFTFSLPTTEQYFAFLPIKTALNKRKNVLRTLVRD